VRERERVRERFGDTSKVGTSTEVDKRVRTDLLRIVEIHLDHKTKCIFSKHIQKRRRLIDRKLGRSSKIDQAKSRERDKASANPVQNTIRSNKICVNANQIEIKSVTIVYVEKISLKEEKKRRIRRGNMF
jgi:hypothetical protein